MKLEDGLTRAKEYARQLSERIEKDGTHNAIGSSIIRGGAAVDFRDAGARQFERISKLVDVEPKTRVVDYGCGSLRIGYHVIAAVDPGNYMGLDVSSEFIDAGIANLGEMLEAKRPVLREISEESVEEAAAFAPRFVFSANVAYHVPPEEQTTYFENMKRIAHRKGTAVYFDAKVSSSVHQYGEWGWSYPSSHYLTMMEGFRLVSKRTPEPVAPDKGHTKHSFLFRRLPA